MDHPFAKEVPGRLEAPVAGRGIKEYVGGSAVLLPGRWLRL